MDTVLQEGYAEDAPVFATNAMVLVTPPGDPAGVTAIADLQDPGLTERLKGETVSKAVDEAEETAAGPAVILVAPDGSLEGRLQIRRHGPLGDPQIVEGHRPGSLAIHVEPEMALYEGRESGLVPVSEGNPLVSPPPPLHRGPGRPRGVPRGA